MEIVGNMGIHPRLRCVADDFSQNVLTTHKISEIAHLHIPLYKKTNSIS